MTVWTDLLTREELDPVQKLAELLPSLIDSNPSDSVVDVGFFGIAVTEELVTKTEFEDALVSALDYGHGSFSTLGFPEFAGGPSYIALGAWIGSQQLALILMGVGSHFNCWSVVGPSTLGIEGKAAEELMGRGFLMIAPGKELHDLWEART